MSKEIKARLSPSQEVLERARKKGYEQEASWLISPCRAIALLTGEIFGLKERNYLGCLTFSFPKIKNEKSYFFSKNNAYLGKLLREGLQILRKRRLRVFITSRLQGEQIVLFLGTKEGTIAIAPRVIKEPYSEEEPISWEEIVKKKTTRFVRGILYDQI